MIFYSKSKGGFYTDELKKDYEAAGNWPDDLIEITNEEHQQALYKHPLANIDVIDGKLIINQPTDAQLLDIAKQQKIAAFTSEYNKLVTELSKPTELDGTPRLLDPQGMFAQTTTYFNNLNDKTLLINTAKTLIDINAIVW